MNFVLTFRLVPLPDGRSTRLHTSIRGHLPGIPGPLRRLAARLLIKATGYTKDIDRLVTLVSAAGIEPSAAAAGLPSAAAA
jgi:hypothetical protein